MKLVKITFFLLMLFLGCSKIGALSLPALFADNMVLQRNATVQFWGAAESNAEVSITTPWGIHKGKADVYGKWQIGFSTPNENPSFSIVVCANSECIEINNVVLGEVWLASGQSNMEMPLKGWLPEEPILNSEKEITKAGNFEIRIFSVERNLSNLPLNDVHGKWLLSDSINAPNFSATAYFFAKEL